ncbi:MAG TPA: HAD family hydrolase [bacterium]|nr:HAD family hydrolase [bacterium]HEX67551.1 HAD family hydrolase [bacterium]
MKTKIVSFDVDGTLVDQRFNDIIWEEEIPRHVAKIKGWKFEKARKYVIEEYAKIGDKDLRWYDINYWLKRFGIKVSAKDILKKWEKEIRLYPDVIPVLEKLKKEYSLIIITCMPRIFLGEKIHTISHYFLHTFSTVSDFHSVKSPQVYKKIASLIGEKEENILHIGDHPILDYEYSRQAGYRSLLLRRGGGGGDCIKTLEEVFNYLCG